MNLSENILLRCRQAPQARKIGNFSRFHNKIQCFRGKKQLTDTGTTFLTGTGMALGALTVATPLNLSISGVLVKREFYPPYLSDVSIYLR